MSQQNLLTARDQIDAIIASITASPKPSYSVDGKSVSWESYLAMLLDKKETLERAIMMADGPYEARSRGI